MTEKQLQDQIILNLGNQIVGLDDDTAATYVTADELELPKEIINAVIGVLPEIFRDYDGIDSASFHLTGGRFTCR
jgi:hypothetical protein